MNKSCQNITSYDALKCLALLLMLVDHIGAYFLSDTEILRAIGRISVPIWFFLIGYARTRDITRDLVIALGILIALNMFISHALLPLNILANMILMRLCIDFFGSSKAHNNKTFYARIFLLVIAYLPLMFVLEYGTMGLICGLLGYFVRHNSEEKNFVLGYMFFAAFIFSFSQYIVFGFSQLNSMIMTGGVLGVSLLLIFFKPVEYARLSTAMPTFLAQVIMFCGRHTLALYVIHLCAFRITDFLMAQEGYGFLDIKLFEPGAFDAPESTANPPAD